MRVLKIISKILLIALLVFCFAMDCTYLIIKYCIGEKLIVNTYSINDLKNVEDESEKSIFNLVYYTNKDNSGVELVDFKLNSYMTVDDLTSENPSVYGYGYQAVGTTQDSIKYGCLCTNGSNFWGNEQWQYRQFMTYQEHECENNIYYYNTHDGISYGATSSLSSDNNLFKISIGDDLYAIHFKTKEELTHDDAFQTDSILWGKKYYYYIYDINYLVSDLLNTARTQPTGMDGQLTCKFDENIFVYQKYDGNGFVNLDKTSDASLIRTLNETYMTVKIKIYDTGAKTAKDSMFGIVKNKSNFSVVDASSVYSYVTGKECLTLDEYDFDYKLINGSIKSYQLSLSETAKEKINNTTKPIVILIDLDNLSSNNILAYGFAENSGLETYKNKITIFTIQNHKLTEVSYDASKF